MSKSKLTMAELARLASVDISTVSRALNDSPLVKEETKKHILSIAAETGYAVNARARSLRRQSSETIGLVIPIRPGSGQTMSDPFYLEMVGAVSQAASERGYDLIVSVPRENEFIAEQRLLQTGRADGLILIGQADRSDRLETLGALAQKVVVWGGRSGKPPYTIVGSDNIEGGRLAADHLLSGGRRNLLFIGPAQLPEVKLRLEGFRKAHEAHAVEWSEDRLVEIEFGAETAFDELLEVFRSGPEFDAVFAASDVLALAAIMALRACGKNVPEDIHVVGYDNIGQAAVSTPSLTTIDQSIAEGGKIMVEKLLEKLSGHEAASTLTSTRLIVRESTGRAD